MDHNSSNEAPASQPVATESSAGSARLELIKVVLDFASKCLYPAIALLLIALLYPAIGTIDLKGLVARLQSAKAGGYEFAFSEALKAKGGQTAEINGSIEELKLTLGELSQDVAALKKATPKAAPPPEQVAKRQEKEQQFSNNSDYSILVFYKPYQKEMVTALTKQLLSLGFKSSATPTDLKEAVKQFDRDTAWIVYTERGEEKLRILRSTLPSVSGRSEFVYGERPYNLRSGDIQILLF